MRFLADMGVDQRVVRWLEQNGDDATHLRDQGLQRLPDSDIFDKADLERRIILTFDLEFGEIAAFSRGRTVSVVLFRLHNTRTPHVGLRGGNSLPACYASAVIDIHSHIMPAIDDGARTVEEAVEMARIAAEDGIEPMVSTPHMFNSLSHNPVSRFFSQ